MMQEVKIVCVQCQEELEWKVLGHQAGILHYCSNPKCPNYGLYQIGEKNDKM